MRSREDITADAKSALTVGALQHLVLEVLLDIRDNTAPVSEESMAKAPTPKKKAGAP